ncbi:hypothetical protein [Streptomyces sp. KR80]|uniref:hypothetical protein n=1 Tax=Streptomyces sp. KR80 TaxID=3457426 RepID=UPI003FD2DF79
MAKNKNRDRSQRKARNAAERGRPAQSSPSEERSQQPSPSPVAEPGSRSKRMNFGHN